MANAAAVQGVLSDWTSCGGGWSGLAAVASVVNVCARCGAAPGMAFLGEEGPLCDFCFDARISVLTGWPRLPAPPPPKTVTGPDGREHRLRFRLWRTPGGISAEAIEQVPDGGPDDGYVLKVFGDHDADPALLLAELEQRVLAEISCCYLEHDDERGWQTTGTQVAGRVGFVLTTTISPTSSWTGAASAGRSSGARSPRSTAGGSGWTSATTFRRRPQRDDGPTRASSRSRLSSAELIRPCLRVSGLPW